ncbi:hypothetical protein ACFL1H_06460, partial [Nanoarchaeota archaeon]
IKNDSEKNFGYQVYQGKIKVMLGKLLKRSNIINQGIDRLLNSRKHIPKEFNKNILSSLNIENHLGEAYQILANTYSDTKDKINAHINSIVEYYNSIGLKQSEFTERYLGFSWFKLGQHLSEIKDFPNIQDDWNNFTVKLSGETLNRDSSIRFCFSQALKSFLSIDGDDSKERSSKIGNAYFELAKIVYDEEHIEKLIIKSNKYIEDAMGKGSSYSYVLKGELAEFSREILGDNSNSYDINEILKVSWEDVIKGIFNNNVEIQEHHKGSTKIRKFHEDNAPIRFSFIIKEFDDEETANLEYLITKASYDTMMDEELNFSRPIDVVNYEGKYYFIIKRHSEKDLEDVFNEKDDHEKILTIDNVMQNVSKFHKSMTKRYDDLEIVDENINYKIEEYDFLKTFVERLFVGKDKNKVRKMLSIIGDDDFKSYKYIDKKEYFNRLPFNTTAYKFMIKYKEFIENNLIDNLPKFILHCDLYPSNVLNDGTIIDPKLFKYGNPLIDLAAFFENPIIDCDLIDDFKEKFIEGYLDEILDEDNEFQQKKMKKMYNSFALHNNICNIGSKIAQGKIDEANFFLGKSLKLLKDQDYSLYNLFYNCIYNTGMGDLKCKLKEFDPEKYNYMKSKGAKLKIGIDFDNVVGDPTEIKIDEFKRRGIDIGPEDCSKSAIVKKGVPEDLYEKVVDQLYASRRTLSMKSVNNVKEVINSILLCGHEAHLISSRTDQQMKFAKRFLRQERVSYTKFHNTNNGSKFYACKDNNIDIMLDDSYDKLKHLKSIKTECYLFTTPTNKDIDETPFKRLDNWHQFYTVINEKVMRESYHRSNKRPLQVEKDFKNRVKVQK